MSIPLNTEFMPRNRLGTSSIDLQEVLGGDQGKLGIINSGNIDGTPEEIFTGSLRRSNFSEFVNPLETASVVVNNEHGLMKVTKVSVEDEIRRATMAMSKELIAYKYYSSVAWMFAVALAVFVVCGIVGALGPLSTFTGSLLSLVGSIGAILNWKGWKEKNADQSKFE
ncbi:hypothetical protein P9222_08610 [Paenibacillus amylolyticus]|nr:hypothetical protein [Paenibacillus amylolyticus]WFR63012.1 hypothetical protein P9222_00755 [Paenibacillus amylolyticus]WFR64221.1 hypothetical protein P9222_08610 [Paenibacillus amylolyticus]